MLCQRYTREELSPRLPLGSSRCSLTAYCRRDMGLEGDRGGRWAAVICPGGGYQLISPAEGEPVALELLARGVQAFVLRYSVAPDRYPQQLLELAAAVAFIRQNAAQFNVSRIAVCGFSAGGHLAGCLSNLWRSPLLTDALGGRAEDYRPDAAILGYPVISSGDAYGLPGCYELLLGRRPGPEDAALSLEASVTAQNPPTFLWCTVDDPVVPMENTLHYLAALKRAGVPAEAHLFASGPHAMAAATADSAFRPEAEDHHVAQWLPLCAEWLKGLN